MKAFISYTWDSEQHKAWVKSLADGLIEYGIDTVLDQYDLKAGDDMHLFMESSIEHATHVLIVCTPDYVQRANSRRQGVGEETSLITGSFYSRHLTGKTYIPILRQAADFYHFECLPVYLRNLVYIDFINDEIFSGRLEELAKIIYDEPVSEKPALGEKPKFGDIYENDEHSSKSDNFVLEKQEGTIFVESVLPLIAHKSSKDHVLPSIVFIDIDDLTVINKKYGRNVGDDVLAVAGEIVNNFSFGKVKYRGRCGDDTFYMVFFNSSRIEDACYKLINRVRDYRFGYIAKGLHVTCSIGHSSLQEKEDPREWITRAAQGMVMAKKKGKNNYLNGPKRSNVKFGKMKEYSDLHGRYNQNFNADDYVAFGLDYNEKSLYIKNEKERLGLEEQERQLSLRAHFS